MIFRRIMTCFCILLCFSLLTPTLIVKGSDSYTFSSEEEIVIRGDESAEELRAKQDELERRRRDAIYTTVPETNLIEGWPQGPGNHGEAAIIMELHSGAIVYAKNIDESFFPASITKLMTLLVALEEGNFEDSVTVTQECVDFLEPGDAAIGLQPGQILSLESTLYSVMLASANEGAHTVAANLGEGYDWFINRMNERAVELGATNSHFVNPHGLHDEEHYVTARCMALIGKELFKHPEAFTIMQTMQYTIPKTDTMTENTFQQNHKMLIQSSDYYYPHTIGGKTGFTDQARNTLVTFAQQDDRAYVCVVLRGISGVIYNDTTDLFEYSFNNFVQVPVGELPKHEDIVGFEEDGFVTLPKDADIGSVVCELERSLEEPLKGEATFTYHGQFVGSAKVQVKYDLAEEDVPQLERGEVTPPPPARTGIRAIPVYVWYICGIVLALVLLVVLIILCVSSSKRTKAKRVKRKEMLERMRKRKALEKQDSRDKLDE